MITHFLSLYFICVILLNKAKVFKVELGRYCLENCKCDWKFLLQNVKLLCTIVTQSVHMQDTGLIGVGVQALLPIYRRMFFKFFVDRWGQ
jgi:hypothetical protein